MNKIKEFWNRNKELIVYGAILVAGVAGVLLGVEALNNALKPKENSITMRPGDLMLKSQSYDPYAHRSIADIKIQFLGDQDVEMADALRIFHVKSGEQEIITRVIPFPEVDYTQPND